MNTPWTEAEKELCTSLAAQALSASQIAARLNRTRNSIIGLTHREGIRLNGSCRHATTPKQRTRVAKTTKARRPISIKNTEAEIQALFTKVGKVQLVDAGRELCHWPQANETACGDPAFKKSFCKSHYFIAYRP